MIWFLLNLLRRSGGLLSRGLERIRPGLGLRLLVRAGNRYFRRAFAATPFARRLLFLPYCLRPLDCPTDLDPEQGVLCRVSCPDCEVGRIRQEALALGFAGVYLVPSSRLLKDRGLMPSDRFIVSKLQQHTPAAALGVVCPWYLRHRLLAKYSLDRGGYVASSEKPASVLQGVLMPERNCRSGRVDWDQVRRLMSRRAA